MEFLEFWEFQEVQESSEVVLEKRNQSCSCQGNSQDNPEDPKALRLLWRLQEAEKWHQLERSGLERALLWCQEDAERADSARSRAETEVEQLQRLLAGMEKDHRHLLVRMELGQADLERLRKAERERAAQQEWWEFKNGNSLIPAGEGGGRAPGENPSPGTNAQEPAAQSPPDDQAAAEFQERDPGQGRGDPGAEGKSFLPGSRGGARNSGGWIRAWIFLECRDQG
ncbi:tuftelin-like isoform X1 [Molothrus ater]|uniref:tuftelin-like isoform X1 n=1 Tax=Molothrus ater TaxID=84834 RepID=UPI0017480888|nr:tuftelin-like isoform X1 [Molothrus ater]